MRRWLLIVLALIQLYIIDSNGLKEADIFDEQLIFKPLPDGRLHAVFTFDLQSSTTEETNLPIYSFVPRSLIHLAQSAHAKEIHLAINAGRWDYDTWGIPKEEQMVATGAEVRGMFDSNRDVIKDWRKVTANLAGLFCASLDALDEKLTVKPFHSSKNNSFTELRGLLSSESICTENLSTLLKLLPCKTSAGLASLLKAHAFFISDFHGMAIHMSRNDYDSTWKAKFNVQAVFSPVLQGASRAKRDWSMEKIFRKRLERGCPLVRNSGVTILTPNDATEFLVWPIVMAPQDTIDIDEDDLLSDLEKLMAKAERFANALRQNGKFTFETINADNLNVEMTWPKEGPWFYPFEYVKPQVQVERVVSEGIIEVILRNNNQWKEEIVRYEDVLPWFIRPFLHTLRVDVIPDEFEDDQDDIVRFTDDIIRPALLNLNYTPSETRKKSFYIEAKLRLPPSSKVRLQYEYEKAFLQYAEHPPDAHRGLDVSQAIITLEDQTQIYTRSSLVEMAVPDFSMPYNVIIFTSTLIALCAGSILNNLVRRYNDIVTSEILLE